jgi:hypothetical protein
MALDNVPASSASDGRWKIAYVPAGSNPLSAAVLKGATSKNVTYGFTASGFNYTLTQAEVADPRLTLVQSLTRPGKTTESLEVQYVDSEAVDSPAVLFPAGTTGYLVVRRGLSNETDWAAPQTVDVLTIQAGVQRPDAPTENGLDTITQGMYITAPTQRKAVLVA